ncbi:hypothetical protein MJ575_18380 [Klebsiella pneumoniae]|nr:hypothetical protein MJ575_18380 [Klebsiella pneumoniae]
MRRPGHFALFPARLAIGGALIALMSPERSRRKTAKPRRPPRRIFCWAALFNDVQSAKLFADQKTFADAIP